MSTLFDDIARIVASPIPRRQALRLVGGAMGGALATVLGLGKTSRVWSEPREGGQAPPCGRGTFACGTKCCNSSTQKCCSDKGKYCCPKTANCCRGVCCGGANPACCGTATKPLCCDGEDICCQGKCCDKGPSPNNPCYKARC